MRIVNEIITLIALIAFVICLMMICYLVGNIKPGRNLNTLLKKANQILAPKQGHNLPPNSTGIKTNPDFSLAKHKIRVEDVLTVDRANLKGKTPQHEDLADPWQPRIMTASWYSIESLKKEGTWKTSKGVMANGQIFADQNFTCASRLHSLGSIIKITSGQLYVICKVTDRIGKRFAKTRIDLSRAAMEALGGQWALDQGLVKVLVERIE